MNVDATERKGQLAKVDEAKDYLNVARSTVYKLFDSGELPYVKVGSCRRVRWSDLEAFVSRNTHHAG